MSLRRGGLAAGLALAALASSLALAARTASARPAEVWTRLELVENSAEGPAYDRCAVEATLRKGSGARWRLFYGEARADSASGWSALRSSSGCRTSTAGLTASAPVQTTSSPASTTSAPANDISSWGLSGSPYLVVDVAIARASVAGAEVLLDATLVTRRLTGFGPEGAPAYEPATETRTIRVSGDTSAVIPILIANPKETDEFRVRELLLKFHARVPGSAPRPWTARSRCRWWRSTCWADAPAIPAR